MSEKAATEIVTEALAEIEASLEAIEEEADNYGGWPGTDESSKTATELGLRLAGLSWACAVGGREFAEDGEIRPWEREGAGSGGV